MSIQHSPIAVKGVHVDKWKFEMEIENGELSFKKMMCKGRTSGHEQTRFTRQLIFQVVQVVKVIKTGVVVQV